MKKGDSIPLPYYKNVQNEDRNKILSVSVQIESMVNDFLCNGFGAKNPEDTLSFGNTSKALSFQNKLNLLLDFGAIGKDDKKVFEKFGEIRNKFAHDAKTTTLEGYFAVDVSGLNFLKKMFNLQLDYSNNDNCWKLIDAAVVRIGFCLNDVFFKVLGRSQEVLNISISSAIYNEIEILRNDLTYLQNIEAKDTAEVINVFLHRAFINYQNKNPDGVGLNILKGSILM